MWSIMRDKFFYAFLVLLIGSTVLGLSSMDAAAQSVSVHPGSSGLDSSSDGWRDIKEGAKGTSSLPDENKAFLIRIAGEDWRNIRNSWVFSFGALGLAGVVAALFLFYLIKGRIDLEGELSGRKILRFTHLERYNHWVLAGSFLILGLTGLNMLYGRTVLLPLIGPEAFSSLTSAGKFVHNYLAWAYMASLLLTIVLWTKDNLWDQYDWNWIKNGGGFIGKGVHPPSARFNFGEKTMFWLVALGGLAVSYSGLSLLFPYLLGPLPVMQFMQLVHAVSALGMLIAILGHIYIATVGMEQAITGMKTGYVDETWAREHHEAWAVEHGLEPLHHEPKDQKGLQGNLAE